MKKYRVVIFGCQKIAIDIIDFVSKFKSNKFSADLVAVVTHDEPQDKMYSKEYVQEYCARNNIKSVRFDGKIDVDLIKEMNPDIIFSIYYRKIFPKEIIDLPKLGCINIHPSPLPKYRGPVPTYWMVRNGETIAGTTLHYMDCGMDTGDIIAQKLEPICEMTGFELSKRMINVGTDLFISQYESIMLVENNRKKQNDNNASCVIPFDNNFRYINWNRPAEEIVNHVRAHARPYAGSLTKTYKKGKIVTIHKSSVLNIKRNSNGPGSYSLEDNGLVVQTHTSPVLIEDFYPNVISGRFISGVL